LDLIVENKVKISELYRIFFDGLDTNNKIYYLRFNYTDGGFQKITLNNIHKIIFYNYSMIIFSEEDDRYLFEYDKMDNVEILCMGE